jgi:hypothetical protein
LGSAGWYYEHRRLRPCYSFLLGKPHKHGPHRGITHLGVAINSAEAAFAPDGHINNLALASQLALLGTQVVEFATQLTRAA